MSTYPLFDSCHFVLGGRYRDPARPDHAGLDFTPNDINNPPLVPATAEGRVIYAASGPGYNGTTEWIVIIQHADYWSAYGHLHPRSLLVTAGQWVTKHQHLGTMGYSGYVIPAGKGGMHTHLQTGPGTYRGRLSDNPTFDPMSKLAGDNEDMDNQEIVKGLYRQLDPQYQPADDVVQAQADRLAAEGRVDGVLHDILVSKPWRNPQDADVYAIESYALADEQPGDTHAFAVDKVLAGVNARHLFTEVLSALKGWIAEKEQRITDLITAATTQQEIINQGTGKLTDLKTQVQQRDAEIVELKKGLANASTPTQPATEDPRSGLELIRAGINKWLKGA